MRYSRCKGASLASRSRPHRWSKESKPGKQHASLQGYLGSNVPDDFGTSPLALSVRDRARFDFQLRVSEAVLDGVLPWAV